MALRGGDAVIAAEIANDDSDLLVVTENGYGKRTRVFEYPRKGRGGMGVQTVRLSEARGTLAGALVVRDGYQVMLISTGGTVIKMPVEDVKRLGRSTQGVIVMRLREGEQVSSLALVVDPGEAESGVVEPNAEETSGDTEVVDAAAEPAAGDADDEDSDADDEDSDVDADGELVDDADDEDSDADEDSD
jgi:DNA gyrase subunit A